MFIELNDTRGSKEDFHKWKIRVQDYMVEVGPKIGAFEAAMRSDTPTFPFVQYAKLPGVFALYENLPVYRIVHRRNVGSRDVLLLANVAGAKLLPDGRIELG